MDEKCVCHLNGYRLKDTEARKKAEGAAKAAEDAKKAAQSAEDSIAATAIVANQAKSAADGASVAARTAAQIAQSAESKAEEAKTTAEAATGAEKTAAEAKIAAAAALPRAGGIMTGGLDMGRNDITNIRYSVHEAITIKDQHAGFDAVMTTEFEPGVLQVICHKNRETGANKNGSMIIRGVAPGVADTDAVNMAQVLEMVRNGNGSDSGQNVELDTTLTQSGKAADAKAVGDALDKLEEKIPSIEGLAKEEDIPMKTSELTNDSGYQTAAQVTAIVQRQLGVIENGTY